jgi:hypothetical protein
MRTNLWRPTTRYLRTKQLGLFFSDHRENVGIKAIKRRNSPISVPVRARDACRVGYGLTMELLAGNQNRLVL